MTYDLDRRQAVPRVGLDKNANVFSAKRHPALDIRWDLLEINQPQTSLKFCRLIEPLLMVLVREMCHTASSGLVLSPTKTQPGPNASRVALTWRLLILSKADAGLDPRIHYTLCFFNSCQVV